MELLYYGIALALGLYVLLWSADKFVDGSSAVATRLGMSKLLVGMIIVGFGTSAPEMLVSALASYGGNSGIALGNAFGSNIANIALILGVTVLIRPIFIEKNVITRELPILLFSTLVVYWLLWDGTVSRIEALGMLVLFAVIMYFSITASMREEKRQQPCEELKTLQKNKEIVIASSRALVWGAVGVASYIGISDMIIGLTIVAVGTSLPELASAIAATRKNEHSLVIGNIIGSNFFNALAVVGIAGVINPLPVEQGVIIRDVPLSIILTLSLFLFSIRVGRQIQGIISRFEGLVMLAIYTLYTVQLVTIVLGKPLFAFFV